MANDALPPIRLFDSYSHKDERFRKRLEVSLSALKNEGVVSEWHDRKILAGQEWEAEIDSHLDEADVILLLVSPDFLASAYCYGVEVKRALERHEAGTAIVIPIVLRPTEGWHNAPFGKLQGLPTDGKPVTDFHPQDKAFHEIAAGIRQAVTHLREALADEQSVSASTMGQPPSRRLESAVEAASERITAGIAEDAAISTPPNSIERAIVPEQTVKHSLQDEMQLMMKVAQLTVLKPYERYLLRRLYPDLCTRSGYWAIWPVPSVAGYPGNLLSEGRARLIALGLVDKFPLPPQTMVQLAPGVSDAISRYESLYGVIHPTPEEERIYWEQKRAFPGIDRKEEVRASIEGSGAGIRSYPLGKAPPVDFVVTCGEKVFIVAVPEWPWRIPEGAVDALNEHLNPIRQALGADEILIVVDFPEPEHRQTYWGMHFLYAYQLADYLTSKCASGDTGKASD